MDLGTGLFTTYWLLLVASGTLMICIGAVGFAEAHVAARIGSILFGLAFFAYGIYLGFFFEGGHYIIFFKAFILPVFDLSPRSYHDSMPGSIAPKPFR